MDERDFRIIVELQRNPFASAQALGRVAGVSGAAVQARLGRLRERGTLRGLALVLASEAYGREERLFFYPAPPNQPSLEDITEIEDVTFASRGHPDTYVVMVSGYEPPTKAPAELTQLIGTQPAAIAKMTPPTRTPADVTALSPLDWRVLPALLDNPRAPLNVLAKRTGLSARTVRNRRDRLLSAGLFWVLLDLDATRESGLIVFGASITVSDEETLRGLRIPGAVRLSRNTDPPGMYFIGRAETLAAVRDLEDHLKGTLGATNVFFTIPRGQRAATSRIVTWAREERAKWDAARRGHVPAS